MMGDEERAADERERAVIAHRRAAKARRWSLRELRLSAALRLERGALGSGGAPASLGDDNVERKA